MEAVAFEERRGCPRLAAQLQVKLAGLTLTSTNLSPTGMQLACPNLMFAVLQDRLEADPVTMVVTFPDRHTAELTCRVVYEADYGDEVLVGVRFCKPREPGCERIQRYCLGHGRTDRRGPPAAG
jgi:hypothetical protein